MGLIVQDEKQVTTEVEAFETGKTFMELLKLATEIKAQAPKVRVKNDEDQGLAVETIAEIKRVHKQFEELRVNAVRFPNAFVKSINAIVKPHQAQLKEDEKKINVQLSKYDQIQEEKARKARAKEQARLDREREKAIEAENKRVAEEQARLDADYERRKAEAEEKARLQAESGQESLIDDEPEPIEREVAEAQEIERVVAAEPEVKSTVRTGTGTAYKKGSWKFEVKDVKALAQAAIDGVPSPELVMPNDKVIRGLVKAGIRSIPGVEIWKETTRITKTG